MANVPRNPLPSLLKKESVAGAPVTCVSIPSLELCIYAQGAFLHRASLLIHDDESSSSSLTRSDRLLVFPKGGNIHGIRYASRYAIVFGGRQVAFVQNATSQLPRRPMRVLSIHPFPVLEQPTKKLVTSDWIWDCQVSSPIDATTVDATTIDATTDATTASTSHATTADTLVIGLAHNSVEIWEVLTLADCDEQGIQARCIRTIRGSTRSITYCLDISSGGRVAAGTVTNEILVWAIDYNDTATKGKGEALEARESHRLQGHKGVIHAVHWDKSGQRLASASDDRTVRLWNINAGSDWTLQWTTWGHTARAWSVAFSNVGIVSTGEDGTARLWNAETGVALATFRGHSSQCVWSVDTFDSFAVTGGDDGTVAVYNMEEHLEEDRVKSREGPGRGAWKASFDVPDDRAAQEKPALEVETQADDTNMTLEPAPKRKKCKKKRVNQQVLVGIKLFCPSATANSLAVIVATRTGSLIVLDTNNGDWTYQEPWCKSESLEDSTGVQASEGCCMALHPSGSYVSIGTTRGDAVISPIVARESSTTHEHTRRCMVLPGRAYKTVQRLEWVTEDILISFHIQSILWRTFSSLNGKDGTSFETLALSMGTKGVPLSYAFNKSTLLLATGDSRGNIALFDLNDRPTNNKAMPPRSVLIRVHGKEHVNGILWATGNKLLSVGNDGCISESAVDSKGQLTSLLSVQASSFTGIEHIWTARDQCGTMGTFVAGYFGNSFAVLDLSVGREMFRVDSGGRQRSHDLFILKDDAGVRSHPEVMALAVGVNRKDGRSEVLFHGSKRQSLRIHGSLALHGESIFASCIFTVSAEHGSLALFTGSEDCSSKISILTYGVLVSSKRLPLQESCVRAVCSSRHASGKTTLLVAGGGKLLVQFFLVQDVNQRSTLRDQSNVIDVELLGYGRPVVKASIDHRVNAVAAVPLVSDSSTRGHLVLAGDSNGGCFAYIILEGRKSTFDGFLLYQDERPILSIELVTAGPRVVVLLGTTGGNIIVLDVPSTLAAVAAMGAVKIRPVVCYKAHAVGTNDISATIRSEQCTTSLSILVASGGDDQSICCCELRAGCVSAQSLGETTVERCSATKEAGYSAIKGVRWIDECRLLSTGYDQRLSVWRYAYPSLTLVESSRVDVGDVNSLALGIDNGGTGCQGYTAAVCGSGVEFVSVTD